MKLFKKFACVVSALSMLASLTAFSVSANSRAFNIAVTDESGNAISSISANDKLKITITVDNELDLEGLQYKVNIDTTKVDIDTTSSGRPAVLGFVDKTWWVNADYSNNMRYCFTNGDLKFLSDTNQISIAYAGEKITSEYAVENGVIGIYYVTAKSDITAADPLVVSLSDPAVSLGGSLVKCTSNTVTIPAAPSVVEAKIAANDPIDGEKEVKEDGNTYFTKGLSATLTPGTETVTNVIATFFNKAGNEGKEKAEWAGSYSGATPITFAVNVLNVPDGEDVTATWEIVK